MNYPSDDDLNRICSDRTPRDDIPIRYMSGLTEGKIYVLDEVALREWAEKHTFILRTKITVGDQVFEYEWFNSRPSRVIK